MHRNKHAQQIAERFRQLVEEAGDSLPADHYDELALLIEAGIDTALVESLEQSASQLEGMAKTLRLEAERFS